MVSNQRARLVLHPVVFIALLIVVGLAIGGGLVWHRGGSDPRARGAASSSLAGLQVSSNHLDFGNVGVDRAVSRQLLLRNRGTEPITLRIEGADAFTVEPRSLTVPARGAARVLVTANPSAPGTIE